MNVSGEFETVYITVLYRKLDTLSCTDASPALRIMSTELFFLVSRPDLNGDLKNVSAFLETIAISFVRRNFSSCLLYVYIYILQLRCRKHLYANESCLIILFPGGFQLLLSVESK